MRRPALLAAVALLLAACSGGGEPAAPPPEPDGGLRLWSSAGIVPVDGAEVAVAIVNGTAGEGPTFGVGATLQRWDGAAWVAHRQAVLCVDFWACDGRLHGLAEPVGVEDIGLGAAPRSVGGLLWLDVDGLDAGRYRLALRGFAGPDVAPVAIGAQLEVVDKDVALSPRRALGGPVLTVGPGVVDPDGGEVRIEAVLPAGGLVTAEDLDALWAGAPATVTVERWDRTSWTAAAAVELESGDATFSRRVELPALAPGAYRVVAGELEGRFWVEELDL